MGVPEVRKVNCEVTLVIILRTTIKICIHDSCIKTVKTLRCKLRMQREARTGLRTERGRGRREGEAGRKEGRSRRDGGVLEKVEN